MFVKVILYKRKNKLIQRDLLCVFQRAILKSST